MPRTQPFDEYLDEYEAWFERHRFIYLSELTAVRHFVPEGKNGVEIGIGTGRFALPLGIKAGVEPSRAMREHARQKGLDVREGVAEDLPLSNQSFDFALMVTTVCFVDDILKSFYEVHRILKPDGSFIVGLVDRTSPLGKSYEKLKNVNKFYRPATFYSTDDIVRYLNKTGFEEIQVLQTVFGDLESICEIQPFRKGYGQGGFVVVKGTRSS
jgi:SAM-dependent methyltransferase